MNVDKQYFRSLPIILGACAVSLDQESRMALLRTGVQKVEWSTLAIKASRLLSIRLRAIRMYMFVYNKIRETGH